MVNYFALTGIYIKEKYLVLLTMRRLSSLILCSGSENKNNWLALCLFPLDPTFNSQQASFLPHLGALIKASYERCISQPHGVLPTTSWQAARWDPGDANIMQCFNPLGRKINILWNYSDSWIDPVFSLNKSHKHSTLQACIVAEQPRSTGSLCSFTGVQLTPAVLSLHLYSHKCRFQHPLLPCAPYPENCCCCCCHRHPPTPHSPTHTLSNTLYDTDACWQRGDSRYGTKITAKTIAWQWLLSSTVTILQREPVQKNP